MANTKQLSQHCVERLVVQRFRVSIARVEYSQGTQNEFMMPSGRFCTCLLFHDTPQLLAYGFASRLQNVPVKLFMAFLQNDIVNYNSELVTFHCKHCVVCATSFHPPLYFLKPLFGTVLFISITIIVNAPRSIGTRTRQMSKFREKGNDRLTEC